MSNEALVVVVKDLRKKVEKLNKLRLDTPQKIKQRVSFQAEMWGIIRIDVYAKEHGEGKSLHHLENALSSVEASKKQGDGETKCVVKSTNTITLESATEVEYSITIDSKITSKKPSAILTNTFELVVVPTFLIGTSSSQPLRPPDKLTYEPLLYIPTNSSQTDVQTILKSYYQQPSTGKLVLPPPPKVAAEYSVTTAPPPLGMVASQVPVTEAETNKQDEVAPTQSPKRPRDATTSNRALPSKKQKQKHHSTSPPTSTSASSLSEPVDATERDKLLEQFNSLVDATEPYRPEDTIKLDLDDNVLI